MATTAEELTVTGAGDYRSYAARALPGLGGGSAVGLVSAVNRGFRIKSVKGLLERYGIAEAYLVRILGISPSTLRRRKRAGRLSAEESDRLVRIAGLYAMAEDILGDSEAASGWMREPNRGLGGASPAEFMLTEVGAREVEDLLGRLAHGIAA